MDDESGKLTEKDNMTGTRRSKWEIERLGWCWRK